MTVQKHNGSTTTNATVNSNNNTMNGSNPKKQQKQREIDISPQSYNIGQSFNWLGYPVTITEKHLQPRQLNNWRQIGDQLADRVVEEAEAERKAKGSSKGVDYVEYCMTAYYEKKNASPAVHEFMKQITTVPSWFDSEKFNAGREVLLTYPIPARISLLTNSLIGLYVSRSINKVLDSTNYLAATALKTT